MSKQCCRSSDVDGANEEFFVQECRKKTASGTHRGTRYCCDNEENKKCCKNCSKKISTPCCEVIESKTCIDHGSTEEGKIDKSPSNKCVPCKKITVVSNRKVYCDEEEEKESKGCCKGSSSPTCVPCCEIVTIKKRIDYNLTNKDNTSKSDEKTNKKCVPCLKNPNQHDRTVYCDGQECSVNGCTPCCEVTNSKQRINYAPGTIEETRNEGKCVKKCVPCYDITCFCERTIYCDKEENPNCSGENCDPCCEDITCKKRICYSPNQKRFGNMNEGSKALTCGC